MSAVLQATDVHVRLGKHPILHGVTLSVNSGELCGLLGPNGAGKTTLLRTLLGLVRPSSGSVNCRGRLGYVPQNHHMAWDFPLSVRQVVANGRAGLRGFFRPLSRADIALADQAIERVGMSDLRERPVGALSGGQRQRVLMARALALEPSALLLDEPFTGMDLPAQEKLLDLTTALVRRDGVAVMMSTHNIGEAVDACDSVALLGAGRLIAGPTRPDELSDPQPWMDCFSVRAGSPLLRAAGVEVSAS